MRVIRSFVPFIHRGTGEGWWLLLGDSQRSVWSGMDGERGRLQIHRSTATEQRTVQPTAIQLEDGSDATSARCWPARVCSGPGCVPDFAFHVRSLHSVAWCFELPGRRRQQQYHHEHVVSRRASGRGCPSDHFCRYIPPRWVEIGLACGAFTRWTTFLCAAWTGADWGCLWLCPWSVVWKVRSCRSP